MASLKLLIVEDDAASLELMKEVFTSLKAEVQAIDNGQQASAAVNKVKYDGIFLDLQMPGMSGFELARQIRQSSWNKSTPIIIVTGRDDRNTMQEIFAQGATFYLQKPVDRQKLTSLFKTVRGTLMENRRKHLRVPLQVDVTCHVGAKVVHGVTWNLSQGGMQVEASDLKPNDAVRLSFRLPVSNAAIDAAGKVAWASANRQGIQFTKVSAQSQQSIREYVAAVEK